MNDGAGGDGPGNGDDDGGAGGDVNDGAGGRAHYSLPAALSIR